MHTLTIGDTATHYWTYGDTANKPLIMIHGFRGTHNGLELIAKELEHDFYVIVPDLPGFGDSDAFPDLAHNLENYTEFLGSFISALNLNKKPVLLGHSFGSIVASSFAAKYHNSIGKLILINPIGAPALEGPKGILSRLAIAYYGIGRALPSSLSHPWLAAKPVVWLMSKTMTKSNDKRLIRYIDNEHYTHFSRFKSPRVVSEAFTTSVTHTVREFAPTIEVPTLLIVGDRDDITPLAKQRELVELFPDARLEVIQSVGHLVHYETPAEAAKLINEFSR